MKIEKAIELLESINELYPVYSQEHLKNRLAIEALQEKLAREKGCGWCNKYRMEFNAIDDDGGTVTVDHMVLGDICGYCPVCGRKLGESDES